MLVGANRAGGCGATFRALATALLVGVAGCGPSDGPASSSSPAVLRVGFGLTTSASAQTGIQPAAMNIALEGLIAFGTDGRPRPWLAKAWHGSSDGLTRLIQLRTGVLFHDGTPVTASAVVEVLAQRLSEYLGPAFKDIERITAVSESEIEIVLKRPSNFVLEGLDVTYLSRRTFSSGWNWGVLCQGLIGGAGGDGREQGLLRWRSVDRSPRDYDGPVWIRGDHRPAAPGWAAGTRQRAGPTGDLMAASPRGTDPTKTLLLIAAVVGVIAVLGVGVALLVGGDDEEPARLWKGWPTAQRHRRTRRATRVRRRPSLPTSRPTTSTSRSP